MPRGSARTVPPVGWPAPTRRFREDRWLLDAVIRAHGVDWDQGRTRYLAAPCGPTATDDFAAVRDGVRKFADIGREFAAAAARREAAMDAALAAGSNDLAAEHGYVAAILWGAAEWPFFASPAASAAARDAGTHRRRAYDVYRVRADHEIRPIALSLPDGSTLDALLHLPQAADGPVPCVIHVGGMDSFKEHAVARVDDRYLRRGIAVLTFDGPGQGQAIHDGVWVSPTNWVGAGRAAVDALRADPAIDGTRIGVNGVSFGSFWATQIAGAIPDLVSTAVWAVIHEPGLGTIFESASPTFKARFMAMAGIVEEAEFDEMAHAMDVRPAAAAMACPYLVLAGEDDELSPIDHTFRLLGGMSVPRDLVVYRGERHSIGGGSAAKLGPDPIGLVADWFVARLANEPVAGTATIVETDGTCRTEPLERYLEDRR